MVNINVIICNSGPDDGTYFYKNAITSSIYKDAYHIIMDKKQIIIPLDKIVRIETITVED